jgi:hypothetical protein
MEHPEESILALYILEADEVKGRRAEISAHLDHCAGCSQLVEQMRSYYAEVEAIRSKEAEEILPVLQTATTVARRPETPGGGPLARVKVRALQPLFASFRAYPVRWSAAFVAVAAALVFIVPKVFRVDKALMYARAKDEFLVALDENGGELWREYVAPGFESFTSKIPRSPMILDLDRSGKKEIIVLTPPGPSGLEESIECYNANGTERWRYQFHAKMTFGTETFSDEYRLDETMAFLDLDQDGKHEIAFVAHHAAWWPCVVGLLSAKDGKLLGEYWHPGWLNLLAEDLDKDKNERIIARGYNNSLKRNVLVVLDPRRLDGHAPASAEYTPQGLDAAAEKFYILLPDPDLFKFSSHVNVAISGVAIRGGNIEVLAARDIPVDKLGNRAAEVYFDFDDNMNCVKVRVADQFADIHRRLEKQGKLKKKIDQKYLEDLRKGVQYWDGEKFVKEPTMNQRYVEAMAKQNQKKE